MLQEIKRQYQSDMKDTMSHLKDDIDKLQKMLLSISNELNINEDYFRAKRIPSSNFDEADHTTPANGCKKDSEYCTLRNNQVNTFSGSGDFKSLSTITYN